MVSLEGVTPSTPSISSRAKFEAVCHDALERAKPARITFFGNDEGLSVEVKRTLPAVAAAASLIAATTAVVVTRDLSILFLETALAANVGLRLWPRLRRASRLTSIEIRGGVARFVQLGITGREEKTVPLGQLGFPTIRELTIDRTTLVPLVRLRCLHFDHHVDGVRGGQSVPLQILAGYRLEGLEWLRQNIALWMRTFGGIAS
jgi:hypothetical protein